MSEFLSRLGTAVSQGLKGGAPLDQILTHLTGGQGGAAGLGTLVERLRASGLGDRVDSWISTGANRPVAPEELERALGPEETDRAAQQAGMDRPGLLGLLAGLLPRLVDGLTPSGRLPSREEMPQGGLGEMLSGILGQLGGAGAASTGQGMEGAIPRGGVGATPYGDTGGAPEHAAGHGAGGAAGMPRLSEEPPGPDLGSGPVSGHGGPPPSRGGDEGSGRG